MMLKKFFMQDLRSNIANDVHEFLEKEYDSFKEPNKWKAAAFDKLNNWAKESKEESLFSAIQKLKKNELSKYQTICGRATAWLLLNASGNSSKLYFENMSAEALTDALEKATEIVLLSENYNGSNFCKGFMSNVEENIWSLLVASPKKVREEKTSEPNSSDNCSEKSVEKPVNEAPLKIAEEALENEHEEVLNCLLHIILGFE